MEKWERDLLAWAFNVGLELGVRKWYNPLRYIIGKYYEKKRRPLGRNY